MDLIHSSSGSHYAEFFRKDNANSIVTCEDGRSTEEGRYWEDGVRDSKENSDGRKRGKLERGREKGERNTLQLDCCGCNDGQPRVQSRSLAYIKIFETASRSTLSRVHNLPRVDGRTLIDVHRLHNANGWSCVLTFKRIRWGVKKKENCVWKIQ